MSPALSAKTAPAAPEFAAPDNEFAQAVIDGLSAPQKSLPCRFFYDAEGSALFEKITELPEYYPTRAEIAILEAQAASLAAHTPPGSVLVEFGSGSSRKTEIVLAALPSLAAYVPIDVSGDALAEAKERLHVRFPELRVLPVVGDFRAALSLPADLNRRPRLGFFPGSTIGNFTPDDACALLKSMAQSLKNGGRLVIGIDLRKDVARLEAAYDDAAGITAAFNLNILARANRDLGANFDLSSFQHEAKFNDTESRVEIHLVSTRAQTVEVCGHSFAFAEGEKIHTENSYKYSIESFQQLARDAGWTPRQVWTDPDGLFSLHELVIEDSII
jgi:dimethylhistidine N-methyltransferase